VIENMQELPSAPAISLPASYIRQDQKEALMSAQPIKIPGPDHPIMITRVPSRIVVKAAGQVIADSRNALMLSEAAYSPVYYIPRSDVDLTRVERTHHHSYCPYKGEASYYSIPAGGERSANAIWTYETPYAAVSEIKGHFAFYADRIDEIEVLSD
jgi:uncharacterized protein (DUF427 family)